MEKFLQIQNKSLEEFGVKDYKELWTKAKADGYKGLSVSMHMDIEKKAEGEKTFYHCVFSTAHEDRHGDIVKQEWDLKHFKKNPVFLNSHNYDGIEHIIGKIHNTKADDRQLEGDIEFFLDNPVGVLAQKAVEGGFLNTTSVGFIPKEFDDKGTILKSELLEVSAVSVPANPEALFDKKEAGEVINNPEKEEEKIEEPKEVEEEKEEVVEDPAPAEKKVSNQTLINNAVKNIMAKKKAELAALQKAVQQLTDENKESKRKEINQIVRSLLSAQGIDSE